MRFYTEHLGEKFRIKNQEGIFTLISSDGNYAKLLGPEGIVFVRTTLVNPVLWHQKKFKKRT